MQTLVIMQLVFQGLVPIGLVTWLAFGRESNRADWLIKCGLIAIYILAIRRAGLWLALPWYLPRIYGLLWLVAMFFSWPRVRVTAWRPPRLLAWLRLSTLAALVLLVAGVLAYGRAGKAAPKIPVAQLVFPLHGGTYVVANGGSNTLLNPHLSILNLARARAYRGQSWAIDIVKTGRWGSRRAGIAPRDPDSYAIFGETIHAPCNGTIVTAVDGLPDLNPPHKDRIHMAGNHVIVSCRRVWVVMAHLKQNSVTVHAGDNVVEGQLVGRVGNSGNTDEPHLHMHAQAHGTAAEPMSGTPFPMRLNGKFLARNDRVRAAQRVHAWASGAGQPNAVH